MLRRARAFEADHQRLDGRVAAHGLDTRHHGLGDVVAAGDAAEDVHEDGLHLTASWVWDGVDGVLDRPPRCRGRWPGRFEHV